MTLRQCIKCPTGPTTRDMCPLCYQPTYNFDEARSIFRERAEAAKPKPKPLPLMTPQQFQFLMEYVDELVDEKIDMDNGRDFRCSDETKERLEQSLVHSVEYEDCPDCKRKHGMARWCSNCEGACYVVKETEREENE